MKSTRTINPAWWGLAFVGYALASLAWAAPINLAAVGWLALLVGAFGFSWFFLEHWILYLSLAVGMTVNVGVATMQWLDLGFQDYMVQNPNGLFGNANYFACTLVMALAAALAERLYWFLPIGALGLWLASSRGAIAAAGGALVVWLWPRSKFAVMIFVPLTIVAVIAVTGTRGAGFTARLGIWQDTLNHLTFFGHGWGTFGSAYAAFPIRTNMTEFVTAHAYNDFLELIFELGIGAILFWVLLAGALERAAETERLLLVSFIVLALTYFPLHLTITGPLVAIALGRALAERKPHGSLASYGQALPKWSLPR